MANERDSRALVALPAARDQAIARLQAHYAHGHIELEELERQIEAAERARTDAELAALFRGLPPLVIAASDEITVPGRVTATISATLGATTRRGRWRLPSRVRVRALLASVELDLTEVELAHGESVIEVSAVLASVVITVPEGLAVDCEGSAILGSFDHLAQAAASKRDPRRVRIVGKARLGSVDIVVKKKAGLLDDLKSTVRGLLGP